MAGTDVEPSKTTHGEITLDLSAAAGPAVEERQEDDQEDVGQEGGQKGGGEGEGGHFTCVHYGKGVFFLHCRTSAKHCRSTTGMSEERNQISPKAKANKNNTPTKQSNTHKKPTQAKIQGNLQTR